MEKMVILGGPSHAEEVALEKLSYLTLAALQPKPAKLVASYLECRYIKTSISKDMLGMEYTSILKNIVAVASGICRGLGYGDNHQAVLISNATKEIKRFLDHVDPSERDLMNSAYLGDLLVTTYSQFSRNRTFGQMIGTGYSVRSAHIEMDMIAEGYYAAKSIHDVNQIYKVDMPIQDAVYRILYENVSPAFEMNLLSAKMN